MTAKRFTVDNDGKYWDRLSNKYVTIDHLFYLVEKLEEENERLKKELESFKPIIFKNDGKPIILYEKGNVEC